MQTQMFLMMVEEAMTQARVTKTNTILMSDVVDEGSMLRQLLMLAMAQAHLWLHSNWLQPCLVTMKKVSPKTIRCICVHLQLA